MTRCRGCNSIYLDYYCDYIFDHKHEWINCYECDDLYVKRIDTGEWIETSTLNCMSYVKNRPIPRGEVRSVAS